MNIGKLITIVVTALAVIGFALTSTSAVFAQSDNPVAQVTQNDFGFGGRGGMMGVGMEGPMHDYMISYVADQLGLTVEDIESRLANGETLSSIALSTGLTADEFSNLLLDARNFALDQAVADGTLTQTQADWMKSRSSLMGGNGSMMRGSGTRTGRGTGTCLGLQ